MLRPAGKVDLDGFFEALGRASFLGDIEPVTDNQGKYFVVEVIVFGIKVDVLQDLVAEGAVTSMILAQSIADKEVLRGRQETVGGVFAEV